MASRPALTCLADPLSELDSTSAGAVLVMGRAALGALVGSDLVLDVGSGTVYRIASAQRG